MEWPLKEWKVNACSLIRNICLKLSAHQSHSELKRALISNCSIQIDEMVKGTDKKHKLNKLLTLRCEGFTLHIPPLCIAVCNRNLHIVHCLLENGADPNRLGQVHSPGRDRVQSIRVTVNPLLLAIEDDPGEGFPFDPAIASALVSAGADIDGQAVDRMIEDEEEGGSIDYVNNRTFLHRCISSPSPSRNVFYFLLDKGANLLRKDAHGKTPLQSVLDVLLDASSPKVEILIQFTQELIRRGAFTSGVEDPAIPSVFKLILYSLHNVKLLSLLESAHLLLDAGYKCTETDVDLFDKMSMWSFDSFLSERIHGRCVYSLKHICRLNIRAIIWPFCCQEKLPHLPCPEFLQDYLNLKL